MKKFLNEGMPSYIVFHVAVIFTVLHFAHGYCSEGDNCQNCNLFTIGHFCLPQVFIKNEFFHCEKRTNKVLLDRRAYLECRNGTITLDECPPFHRFSRDLQGCVELRTDYVMPPDTLDANKRLFKRSSGSKTGDMCNYNTDCQSGMYCFNGVCSCLSEYVAISGYCWPKVNPGDSGCVEDLQCEAVWPGARCSRGGVCECPDYTQPSKTRDGTVCVTSGVPPACPLPEPNNPDGSVAILEAPNPATILGNPSSHPLAQDTYMPVLCASTSNEVERSNNGDGSTWCIYPDGNEDIFIADIYNCIPHPQVKPEFFPEYSETIDGICCHSRAFVCIQPMEQGDEPSVPRWWYNSVTGTCSQFLWDPSQTENVSPNNFRTVEHCESYCRDTCRRGPTQFGKSNRGSLIEEAPISNCLHQTGSCGPEFHCTLIGSHQNCCPTIGNICSSYGGRSSSYLSRERFDAGTSIAGSRSISRFYYDTEQGKCSSFVYAGLGNYNNFFTKQDCENFCSKLVCEYGNPLRIGEDWQRCETNNDCPHSHQCESAHKVCCPTAQSICTQPKRHGDCTSSVRRYWYNAATRQCELFQYTGCQGNDNNFDTLLECQQKCRNVALEPKCPQGRAHLDANNEFSQCTAKVSGKSCPPNFHCFFDGTAHGCCPTKAYTCSLSADKGIQCGSGRSFRYFFNANKQTCESFQYEGCDGNSNNFQSIEECQDFCGVGGCPNGGQPLRDVASNEFTTCNADEQTGCPDTFECIGINFGGSMAHRCCPTKAHICSLPPQPGSVCTKASVTRWYFNIVTKECGKFSFNGCNGNLNNFISYEQCTNFCSSSACAPGELAFKDLSTKELTSCSPTILNSCPLDYKCRYDALSTKHICCGSPHSDVCPAGEKAYINALDESVKECAINIAGSCPSNFLCRFSAPHNRYYCCASRSGNMCPDGRALHRLQNTYQPTRCSLNSAAAEDVCPENFSCQSRVTGVIQGYCCSTQDVCKNGAEFIIDEKTLMPKVCMHGAFSSCSIASGYRCHRATASSPSGYCCKDDGNEFFTAGCPPGEFVYTKDEEVVICDPFNPQDKGCPSKYTCQYAVNFQRYQCCGKELIEAEKPIISDHGCLPGQVAYVQLGALTPKLCTSSAANSCPLGFFCQFSEKNKQYQCCAHKASCPRDTVAYIDMHGSPHSCKASVDSSSTTTQCPVGYSCRQTLEGGAICCTVEGVDKYISPSTPSLTERPIEIMAIEQTTALPTSPKSLPRGELVVVEEISQASSPTTFGSVTSTAMTTTTATLVKHTLASTTAVSISTASDEYEDEDRTTTVTQINCQSNEHIIDDKCVPRKVGERCLSDRQCPRSSRCVDFLCKCPSGTVKRGRQCVPEVSSEENESNASISSVNTAKKKSNHSKRGRFISIITRPGNNSVGGQRGSANTNNKWGNAKKHSINNGVRNWRNSSNIVFPPKRPTPAALKCLPNEVAHAGRCLRRNVPLGAICVADVQCRDNAVCDDFRCKCADALAGFNEKCYANVCGSDRYRLPQRTAATNVMKCGHMTSNHKRTCSFPHRCTFSKVVHDYICCRSAAMRPLIITGTRGVVKVGGGASSSRIRGGGRTNTTRNSSFSSRVRTTSERSQRRTKAPKSKTMSANIPSSATSRKAHELRQRRRRSKLCADKSRPFLFPGTTIPVKCFGTRSCPTDYYCFENLCCKRQKRKTATAAAKATAAPKQQQKGNNGVDRESYHSAAKLPGISSWKVISSWVLAA